MKDYEHRFLQRRDQSLNGQVHHLERPTEPFGEEQNSHDFSLADEVVDACRVELNLLETPSEPSSWYLDSGATHHVSGDSSVFSSMYPTTNTIFVIWRFFVDFETI